MVIEEMDFPNGTGLQGQRQSGLAAPVQDRLLSVFFDAFLVLPFCSLVAIPSLQALKIEESLGTTALRLALIYANLGFIYILGSSLVLAIFAHYFGGTPGQRLLKIRIAPLHSPIEGERVSVYTLFFRSLLWWSSFIAVGLPFFEILANPRRQAFYDKICDLRIVTEKGVTDAAPTAVESHFLYRWMLMMGAIVAICFGFFYFKIQNGLLSEKVPTETVAFANCKNQMSNASLEKGYLDLMITKEILQDENKACLNEIADHALWTEQSLFQGWGYLAKGLASLDQQEKEKYFLEACHVGAKDEPCLISQFLLSGAENRGDLLRKAGLATGLSRFLLARESISKGQYESALALIRDLRQNSDFVAMADRLQIRMVWRANESPSRSPAGQGAWKEIYSDFEQRFLSE